MVKNLTVMQETWFDPWVGKIPWKREGQPTPVFLPGEFYEQKSLAGYMYSMGSQRVRHDLTLNMSDLTLHFHFQKT